MSIKSLSLPPRADFLDGYLYVIEFADGMVKVGITNHPASRTSAHSGYAKKLGTTLGRVWFSEAHRDHARSEERLITAMVAISADRHRDEYFTGVTFEQARGIAETIFTNRARRPWELAWNAMEAGDREGAIAYMRKAGVALETATDHVDGCMESLGKERLAAV
jgi:predicted GIY-YIG superfamily endonuclease